MADEREKRERDGFASGMRGTDIDEAETNDLMPGVVGGERTYLTGSGAEESAGTAASSREGTLGAVGEMDITGAPAGAASPGAMSGGAGATEGGGTGGGARSSGGTGPGTSAAGGTDVAGEDASTGKASGT